MARISGRLEPLVDAFLLLWEPTYVATCVEACAQGVGAAEAAVCSRGFDA